MADVFKKIAGLFSDSKTRILALIISILIVVGVIWAISAVLNRMHGPLGPETAANVGNAPSIESIPGGWDKTSSPEYIRQVQERNRLEAEKAKKRGSSALPTITESSTIKDNLDPSKVSGGVGFTDLKKLENANPDELKSISLRCKTSGVIIFDKQGNAIGSVSANAAVKDNCCRPAGTVGDDCNVRNASGNIIGRAGKATLGAAIYDPQGRFIGSVGPDAFVRDLSKKILGKIDEEGIVRDLDGGIIATGQFGIKDTLVFDENSNMLGVAGADATIHDTTGKAIGVLGADRVAKNLAGEIIGKASNIKTNTLIYDKNGKLIGAVNNDGRVRDAANKIIGTISLDGSVKNTKGEMIGRASFNIVGAAIYDCSGHLVGVVGSDGVANDADGKTIGSIGLDGVATNTNGEMVGKIGNGGVSLLATDQNGDVIGTVGPDGIARNSKGNILGKLDPKTGQILNNQNKLIGKIPDNALATRPVPKPPAEVKTVEQPDANKAKQDALANVKLPSVAGGNTTSNDAQQLLLAKQRQEELAYLQQGDANRQQLQGLMAGQATQLFTAWAPPTQQYVAGNNEIAKPGTGGAATSSAIPGQPGAGIPGNVLAKAGTIMYATLDTAVNTDQPGPVMATIVSGPLKGAKVLGPQVTRQNDRALVSFNILSSPQFSRSLSINAVAIDADTARTALATGVDNHYLLRYGSLFASAFVAGYATAVTNAGATVITSPFGGTEKIYPDLRPRQKLLVALGNVGTQYSQLIAPIVTQTPPTVTIASGTGVGLLFLSDLYGQ